MTIEYIRYRVPAGRAARFEDAYRRAAVAYLEWGTRMAVIFSRPGATPNADEPMPVRGGGNVRPWQG